MCNHWCVSLQEEGKMWFNRPCPTTLLKLMALSAIHLQPLRMVLLDTLMMDYMTLVDSYLNSGFYEPDELEHVNMVGNSQMPISRSLKSLLVCTLFHWWMNQSGIAF